MSDACILILPDIENNDAGPYKAIFSGRLSDNSKFDVTLRIVSWDFDDLVRLLFLPFSMSLGWLMNLINSCSNSPFTFMLLCF